MRKNLPRIALVRMGGTIGMVQDPTSGVWRPPKKTKRKDERKLIQSKLARVFRDLKSRGVCEITTLSFPQMKDRDSTEVGPHDWTMLIKKLVETLGNNGDGKPKHKIGVDAVVITHGTDTMQYTAGATALGLGGGLKIPIVFTGSQRSIIASGTDARKNLEDAFLTAAKAHGEGIAEVMIVFGNRVLRGCRAIKTSESKFTAFDSPAFPPLAEITANGIHFNGNARTADADAHFEARAEFSEKVLAVELSPGLPSKVLEAALDNEGCEGVILKSFGAGNVPRSLSSFLRKAHRRETPVVVCSKYVGGHVHMNVYEAGQWTEEFGVIPARDLTDSMAHVKLMWLLARGKRTISNCHRRMASDEAGEITGGNGKK